jgi:hypothetical protein
MRSVRSRLFLLYLLAALAAIKKRGWNKRYPSNMREIVHIQAGQFGNQIGAKVMIYIY